MTTDFLKSLEKIENIKLKKNITIQYTKNAYDWYYRTVKYICNMFNVDIDNNNTSNSSPDIFIQVNEQFNEYKQIYDHTLVILLSGEPHNITYNKFDIIIGTTIKRENSIIIPVPQMLFSLNERKKKDIRYNIDFNNKKECCFMYQVNYKHRVDIFNRFNSRMKVDSYGKSCNNMNNQSTRFIYNKENTFYDIAVELYSNYKFVLAIENNIKPGYFTEKLINPILANSIPIYFGTEDAFTIINKKRVIYMYDYDNIDDLIDYILELSNNIEKYNEIINNKIFINDDITLDNYNEFIEKQILTMFGFNKRLFIEYNKDLLINNYDNSILFKLDDTSKQKLFKYVGNTNDEIYDTNCNLKQNNIEYKLHDFDKFMVKKGNNDGNNDGTKYHSQIINSNTSHHILRRLMKIKKN